MGEGGGLGVVGSSGVFFGVERSDIGEGGGGMTKGGGMDTRPGRLLLMVTCMHTSAVLCVNCFVCSVFGI